MNFSLLFKGVLDSMPVIMKHFCGKVQKKSGFLRNPLLEGVAVFLFIGYGWHNQPKRRI